MNPKLILELPISLTAIHNGGRIKIGPDNNLYVVILFAEVLGGITDLEVGPDGLLYVLATSRGGSNCDPKYDEYCIPYSTGNEVVFLELF